MDLITQMPQRRSIRLKDYDYSQEGAYFVTLRTRQNKCLFGKVMNSEMRLNRFGFIVNECWNEIPRHFSNVEIDAFVIMPNHIHGIATIITKCRGTAYRAPTEKFGRPTPKSLPTIIRSFKFAVANRVNALRGTLGVPLWQRNYYEHVIRNETDLNDVRQYIVNNPLQWDMDENNPNCHNGKSKAGEPICLTR